MVYHPLYCESSLHIHHCVIDLVSNILQLESRWVLKNEREQIYVID